MKLKFILKIGLMDNFRIQEKVDGLTYFFISSALYFLICDTKADWCFLNN